MSKKAKAGPLRLASEEKLARFQSLFDRWGGYAVLVSRALPILPEVMAVLAGLARMRFSRFLAALLLGSGATALLFAWLGHASRAEPWWGMLAATVIPLAVWPVFVRLALRHR
jgi:membrane protein DedA with SNARE-associated domain